jgi:hypothetical protein
VTDISGLGLILMNENFCQIRYMQFCTLFVRKRQFFSLNNETSPNTCIYNIQYNIYNIAFPSRM